ncbi:hypothetical protein H5410_043888 [Solanum commersonii]|uniref:Uncharacterized protein n=1 Tax=Solanum commersonii TaxID=4109 RepID=A0A9J5Y2L9_SOLCO|nr:hypothetical protein H5410_043888 [Solanum commersonii]
MESMGWLITEGEINLLHPFSGVQIQLPHQSTTEHYRPRTMDLNPTLRILPEREYLQRPALRSKRWDGTGDIILSSTSTRERKFD